MKLKILLLSALFCLIQLTPSYAVSLLPNQTVEIPIVSNKDIFCQLQNRNEISGNTYLLMRPKAGSFTRISYHTCIYQNGTTMCMGMSGSKILLGEQNEKINIYGATTANIALIITSYANQIIGVTCT